MELYHNREGLEVLEWEMAEAYNARTMIMVALTRRQAGLLRDLR